jgi:hypothetical protein
MRSGGNTTFDFAGRERTAAGETEGREGLDSPRSRPSPIQRKATCRRGHPLTDKTSRWNGRQWLCLACKLFYQRHREEAVRGHL